jgi:hypothetical protein
MSEYSGLTQVKELSKKKPMPSSSQDVKNHITEKMMKDWIWYFPYPLIWSIRCSAGESSTIWLLSYSRWASEEEPYIKDSCIQTEFIMASVLILKSDKCPK